MIFQDAGLAMDPIRTVGSQFTEYILTHRRMPRAEAQALADEICAILLRQTAAYARQYPLMALQGRPLYAAEDGDGVTSVETYQRGELYTYSAGTLRKLHACILAKEKAGENFAREILERTVARYGFASLEDAERAIGAGQR